MCLSRVTFVLFYIRNVLLLSISHLKIHAVLNVPLPLEFLSLKNYRFNLFRVVRYAPALFNEI